MHLPFKALGLAAVLVAVTARGAFASASQFTFPLTVSAGAATCLPRAAGQATITAAGQVENLHLVVTGLPPHTGFDVFMIQVPKAPFGMAWYQGDIDTDKNGNGVVDFAGRFSIETFIVAPNTAPAPVVFSKGPFPDGNANPASPPIHTYHMGVWFDSPLAAKRAGCANTVTPFDGPHKAGIQALNTGTFPDLAGPLINFHP